jgi:hypothetical protein
MSAGSVPYDEASDEEDKPQTKPHRNTSHGDRTAVQNAILAGRLVEELDSVDGDPNDDSDDPLKKLQYILAENGKLTTVIEELYTAYTIDGCIEESILAGVRALVPGLNRGEP